MGEICRSRSEGHFSLPLGVKNKGGEDNQRLLEGRV